MNKILAVLKWLLDKPSYVFLSLALIFGLVFIFRLAPLNGTDEFSHFPRVYQISEGTFWQKRLPNNQFGGNLPSNINNMINAYRNLSRESPGSGYRTDDARLNKYYSSISSPGKKQVTATFTSVVAYPPWSYIGPLIGVVIAKAFHTPLIWYVYLGRITSLILWMSLVFLAIRFIPVGKWFLVILALLPTSISQAASISCDSLLNGLVCLLVGLTLALLMGKIKLNWWRLSILSILMISVGIIKDTYSLIGIFPLVLPLSLFKDKMTAYVWRTASFVAVIIAGILFTLRTIHAVKGVVLTPIVGLNINSQAQIHYITHHFFIYFWRTLIQPFTKAFDTIYLGMVGIITNRLIYLSILVMFLLFLGLYLGLKSTEYTKKLADIRWRLYIYVFVICIGTYFLVATALYVGNSGVGQPIVNSLYGRYFLPLFPFLLVIPATIKRRPHNYYVEKGAVLAISLIGLIAMVMSLD